MSEQRPTEDYATPLLTGAGASDYERYLRTDELLALQKTRRRSGSIATSCSSRPSTRPRSCG